MHSVINHAMVLFCLSRSRYAVKRHRRTYLSVPANWNHKGKRADKPKCSCQSERFDVTSKHHSYRQRCSRFTSAACGGPSSCWVSSPQVGPRNTEQQNSPTHLDHVRVWFQAMPSPPAGAAAASPRCWSISRWCLSLRREIAARWSLCLSWSTRRCLWWVAKVIPTVPSGVVKLQVNICFLLLHTRIFMLFIFFKGHQESPPHQSHASFTRKLWNMFDFFYLYIFFKDLRLSVWTAGLDRSGVSLGHCRLWVRWGSPAGD